jgi:hypothetical protein
VAFGSKNCTVGALPAQASHVDTNPIANLGGFDPASRKKGEPVTSGEVMKMLAAAL